MYSYAVPGTLTKIALFLMVFCLLFASFLWAQPKTEVLVLGTIHGNHFFNKNYSPEILLGVFEKYSPQVAILEIRPEYINKENGSGPAEMRWIIAPYCKDHNINVYGMDWWPYKDLEEMKQVKKEFKEKILQDADLKKKFEEFEENTSNKNSHKKYCEYGNAFENKDMYYFNSKETKDFLRQYYANIYQALGDNPNNDYAQKRNLEMSKLTLKIIKENPGKRIIVCTGNDHVFWIEDYLKKINGIKIVDLKEIGQIVPVEKLPLQTKQYLEKSQRGFDWQKIFKVVQSDQVENNPDYVDISVIKKDIEKLLEKSDLNCKEEYNLGMYNYIIKDYTAALKYFENAVNNLKETKAAVNKEILDFKMLSYFRSANMYDLLGERNKALKIYSELENSKDTPEWMKNGCKDCIKTPFTRPKQ